MAANNNATGDLYETAPGLVQAYLVDNKDGTTLTPSDLNETQFRRYVAQIFGPDFAGVMVNEIFHTSANTTVLLGMQAIDTYLSTASNLPQRVGTDVESPIDDRSGVIWPILYAVRHARGLQQGGYVTEV